MVSAQEAAPASPRAVARAQPLHRCYPCPLRGPQRPRSSLPAGRKQTPHTHPCTSLATFPAPQTHMRGHEPPQTPHSSPQGESQAGGGKTIPFCPGRFSGAPRPCTHDLPHIRRVPPQHTRAYSFLCRALAKHLLCAMAWVSGGRTEDGETHAGPTHMYVFLRACLSQQGQAHGQRQGPRLGVLRAQPGGGMAEVGVGGPGPQQGGRGGSPPNPHGSLLGLRRKKTVTGGTWDPRWAE